MYLSWKYERKRVGKNVQLLFFSHLVKLGEYNGWQHHCHCHMIGPHTNYKLPNQQKCEICYQILYIFRFFLFYSTVKSVVTVWICERVQERREREAKFSFELLIISSQMDPIITSPRFLLLLLLYFIVVWAWACSTLVRMGSRVRHRIPCRAVLDFDAAPSQLHRCFRG